MNPAMEKWNINTVADDRQRQLSHELRTHLATVKGYTQFVVRLLHRPDVPRERIIPHAEALERQVSDLERSADDLIEDRNEMTNR